MQEPQLNGHCTASEHDSCGQRYESLQTEVWCRKSGGTIAAKAALASFVLFGISLKATENAQV